MKIAELIQLEKRVFWSIAKYANDEDYENDLPYQISEFEGNVLLNEGIAILQTLLIGTGGTAYSNANAYIGVGTSSTAESATDTGLLGTSAFAAMETSYPSVASQTTTWRAVFGTSAANFAWEEFTVVNASSDSGDNLNRKTSSEGTKSSGQTWTVDVAITFS